MSYGHHTPARCFIVGPPATYTYEGGTTATAWTVAADGIGIVGEYFTDTAEAALEEARYDATNTDPLPWRIANALELSDEFDHVTTSGDTIHAWHRYTGPLSTDNVPAFSLTIAYPQEPTK